MDFLNLLQKRYATKCYDESKVVPAEVVDKIMECARLTPTAVNAQPYHFYVCSGESKKKLYDGVLELNQPRFASASHAIVIASKKRMDEEHLERVLAQEESDGRLPNAEIKEAQDKSRRHFCGIHVAANDFVDWTGCQAYIALGTILYAAASYGVDTTTLEGVDFAKVDEILGLDARNETCQVVVLLGYAAADDFNALEKAPKSRLAFDDLNTFLK